MKRIYSLLLSLLVIASMEAQETITLKGRVVDSKTRNDLPGVTVQLMNADSVVIKSLVAEQHSTVDGKRINTSKFSFEVPRTEGKYLIKASFLGYKTEMVEYHVGKLGKREFEKSIPDILMRADSKVLSELKVTGSKVKFYHRGDTVVYNADAFVLAEGSMLDALIRQMPGVELHDDGRIYHNGQYVESLLLNGKDFFKGDSKVMLDMLPAYTVKQVKVYDKYGKTSEFLGEKKKSDKLYVMDVNLKREYSIGLTANVEAGMGSKDKYLGRLFALRYTDHSRLTLYGNINNLNDSRKPGENKTWTPDQLPNGDSKEKQVGIDYNFSPRNRKSEFNGNIQLLSSNSNVLTETDRVNFFANGNTYDKINTLSQSKNLTLSSEHNIDLMSKHVYVRMSPKFKYSDKDKRTNYLSLNYLSADSLVNSYKKEGLDGGKNLSATLEAMASVKFGDTSDNLTFMAGIYYDDKKHDNFNRYSIDYPSDNTHNSSGYQYFKEKPNREFMTRFLTSYEYRLSKTTLFSIGYSYEYKHSKHSSSLYRLDSLMSHSAESEIGVLPSVMEYEACVDLDNSFTSDYTENIHRILGIFEYDKGKLWCQGKVYLCPASQRLNYQRGSVDTTIVRNSLSIMSTNGTIYFSPSEGPRTIYFQYQPSVDTRLPDLVNLVDIRDATDPQNVKIGNSSLKNEVIFGNKVIMGLRDPQKQIFTTLRMGLTLKRNALAMGYAYNPTTGVRTYRAENVNGNWDSYANLEYSRPLDKRRRWSLSSTTASGYTNSVDLQGKTTTGSYETMKSEVHTLSLGERLGLDYKFGASSKVGVKTNGTWRNVTSTRDNFSRISAFDYNYGFTATLKLPLNFQFTTDLTMYGRRGYEGSQLNTDDLVWNARLSCSMLKGRIVCMLDGFDLLGNLNNVTRTINAQGRTETWSNTLPRYVMFHVAYRFSKKPKK